MKHTKTTPFQPAAPRSETLLDKTTRLAREITDDDAERRRLKTEELRKARLEKEAGASGAASDPDPDGETRKPRSKTKTKR